MSFIYFNSKEVTYIKKNKGCKNWRKGQKKTTERTLKYLPASPFSCFQLNFQVINLHTVPVYYISGPPRARYRSPIAKKIWLSSHARIYRPSTPQSNQKEMSHFLARLGACNLILHIQAVFNRQQSKQGIADQFHMVASRAQASTHRGWVNTLFHTPE